MTAAAPRPDSGREFLRHCVATLAYRGGKAVRGAPPGFAAFEGGGGVRTPLAILSHVNDLLDWMGHLMEGSHVWHDAVPTAWEAEVARFFEGLARVEARLRSDTPLGYPVERLFQGPVADALTHVGQIALLRRLAAHPVRGENYFKADIRAGRVGPEQAPPRYEFD